MELSNLKILRKHLRETQNRSIYPKEQNVEMPWMEAQSTARAAILKLLLLHLLHMRGL